MAVAVTTHVSLLVRLRDDADHAAWREFHDRYADLIRGFASRKRLQSADCDDIVQDVLVKLSSAMPDFHYDASRGKFRSYLKTVVVRAIASKWSQKHPFASVQRNGDALAEKQTPEAEEGTWEIEWRRYHLRQAMRVVAQEFNSADLAAFEQYGVAGRPVQEVAAAVGLSVAQVYQAKSVILRRLGALVEQQVFEEG